MDGVKKPRVAVIGLDGATWNLIKPWVENGKLPTFKKLMENGSWGKLKSVVPTSTSPSWKCYSTGKNPGKLGAYYWYNFDKKQKRITMVNSTSFKSKEIWDYLSEAGYRCGVINMPTTFPPKKINGFMISGFNALDQLDYTFPKSLKGELIQKYDYKVNPSHALRLNLLLGKEKALTERDKGLSEIKEMTKTLFTVAEDLWEREALNFLHLTIFYIDSVQHYMWGPMVEENPDYGKVLPEFWEMIDSEIGRFLQALDEDTYVFIMSDHGFERLKAIFKFNTWLYEKGYLRLKTGQKPSLASMLYKLGINTQRAYRISQSKLGNTITKLVPHNLIMRMWFLLRTAKDETNIIDVLNTVDWEKTKVIAIDEMFFLNLPNESHEYQDLRERLIQEIKQIKDTRTGETITLEVKRGEEEYKGKQAATWPDILATMRGGYFPSSSVSKDDSNLWTYYSADGYSAYHAMDGIFLAYGPGIKKGQEIHEVKIYDLAPTILQTLGIPIPDDIDGRVLKEIFAEPPAEERIVSQAREKRRKIIEKVERLRANRRI